jgi:hypothetical protein
MKQQINLYIESSAPRGASDNDEVTLYGTLFGAARSERLFEFNINRRALARALSLDVAPFYSLGATRPEPKAVEADSVREEELDARENALAIREEELSDREAELNGQETIRI